MHILYSKPIADFCEVAHELKLGRTRGYYSPGGAVPAFRYRQQSIHLREKNIVSPTEISIDAHASIKIAGKGLTFFDEDDVCAGL